MASQGHNELKYAFLSPPYKRDSLLLGMGLSAGWGNHHRNLFDAIWNTVITYASVISNHGPIRFLSPVRFLARKAEWNTCRNFMSVLFPWSHQATGPVWPDTSAYLWFGWIICRTPLYGPRMGIFNVFHILRGPCVTRKGPAPLRTRTGIDTTIIGKNPARASYLAIRGCTGPLRSPHGLFTIAKPVRGP